MTAPDPKKFPSPHTVATYISHRSEKFKTHSTLGMAKNAISGKVMNQRSGGPRRAPCDIWVYEWDDDLGWQELHFIAKDSNLDDHPFYKTSARRGPIKGPSDKAVAEAIASIQRVGQ